MRRHSHAGGHRSTFGQNSEWPAPATFPPSSFLRPSFLLPFLDHRSVSLDRPPTAFARRGPLAVRTCAVRGAQCEVRVLPSAVYSLGLRRLVCDCGGRDLRTQALSRNTRLCGCSFRPSTSRRRVQASVAAGPRLAQTPPGQAGGRRSPHRPIRRVGTGELHLAVRAGADSRRRSPVSAFSIDAKPGAMPASSWGRGGFVTVLGRRWSAWRESRVQ